MTDAPRGYSSAYGREHGSFALVPASYVFLLDDGRVLLRRRAATGYYDGWWAASAAGHVDPGESALDAAVRETREELGVEVATRALRPLTTMHRTAPGGEPVDQRVDFFWAAVEWTGEPRLADPSADALEWFPLDALPEQTVHHERAVLDAYAAGALPVIMSFGF